MNIFTLGLYLKFPFNSLLEVYLTPGKKNVTSGHHIRRFRSHCFKTAVYTVLG